jgi:hypothetical protein
LKAVSRRSEEMRERELTPAEIRGVLLQLARKKISERVARPAIEALNKIMCDAMVASHLAGATQGKPVLLLCFPHPRGGGGATPPTAAALRVVFERFDEFGPRYPSREPLRSAHIRYSLLPPPGAEAPASKFDSFPESRGLLYFLKGINS